LHQQVPHLDNFHFPPSTKCKYSICFLVSVGLTKKKTSNDKREEKVVFWGGLYYFFSFSGGFEDSEGFQKISTCTQKVVFVFQSGRNGRKFFFFSMLILLRFAYKVPSFPGSTFVVGGK